MKYNHSVNVVIPLELKERVNVKISKQGHEYTNKPFDITAFIQGNIIPGYKKGAIVLNVIYAGGIHLIEGC